VRGSHHAGFKKVVKQPMITWLKLNIFHRKILSQSNMWTARHRFLQKN
jgi:hypothetical protein